MISLEFTRSEPKTKLISGSYIAVLLVNVMVGTMLQSYNSTISLYLDSLGYKTTIVGALVSVGLLGSFGCRFFGGKITDRFGRRNTAIVGLVIFALANLAGGFVKILPLLFVSRVIMMFGYAMAATALAVMVVDITPRERMTEGIGYFGLGNSLTTAFAPSIALALFATALAFKSVMLFTVAIAGAAVLLAVFFCNYEKKQTFQDKIREEAAIATIKKSEEHNRGVWNFLEKKAIPATLIGLGSTVGLSIITIYFTHYAKLEKIPNAGLFFTASAICMVASRLTTGKLADRRGVLFCIAPGMAMSIAALLLLPLVPKFHFLLYVTGVLYGLGQGMALPAINSAAVLAASPERRSTAASTFQLQFDFGFAYGSLMWGALIAVASYKVCFLIAAGINTVALLMSFSYFLDAKKR